jgi:Fe-S-cluster containining protein
MHRRLPDLPLINRAISCNDCAACCQHIGHPPFELDLRSGKPKLIPGKSESQADFWRFENAPRSARSAYLKTEGHDGFPCIWLDKVTRRCRHYDCRPAMCREFERGGDDCLAIREWIGIP